MPYEPYYQRVIDQQLGKEDWHGLKLVAGPTGMGKTSAIPNVIKAYRGAGCEKRFVYTTHRHLLIEEMHHALCQAEIPCVYLKNDVDVVLEFITRPGLGEFLNRLERYDFFKLGGKSLSVVEKQVSSIKNQSCILQQMTGSLRSSFAYTSQRDEIRRQCTQFMSIFKEGLACKQLPNATKENLLKDPELWALFPYMEFRFSPAKPVLLLTIHKLLYGFFTGEKTDRILGLENNIIFLDEFDMQEREILTFLCKNPEIQNSFEFVRLFYEEMTRQRQSGLLDEINGDTEKRKEAKDEAKKIIDFIEKTCLDEGFRFPEIRNFKMDAAEFGKDKLSIFQSSVQIMTDPFYLVEEAPYWRIVRRKSSNTLRARRLIDLMSQTTDQILRFFSELWADGLTPEWSSWIEQCYDQKNDNTPGRYKKIIGEFGFYHRPPKLSPERKDKAVTDSIYYRGYNFFRLVRNAFLIAPDEIRLDQKKFTISPEYLLWRLCQSNLVFALSATGDIKRYINSFDLNWLEKTCNYLPIDDADRQIVASLKKEKEAKRKYEVNLSIAKELPKSHPMQKAVELLARDGYFQDNSSGEDQDTAIKFRKQAMSIFFDSLNWIVNESHNQAHLLFFNSFTYIEKLFRPNVGLPKSFYRDIQNTFEVLDEENCENREYSARFNGKPFQIVFLDAAKGRELDDQCFKQKRVGVPLVVVTTYPTASNGVNLKWLPEGFMDPKNDSSDFEGIHLLEAPHFFFSTSESEDDDTDLEKMFLWQIWKLYANHQVSEKQFIVALRELNASQVNQLYKSSSDFLLNQIAIFYQALGRVDRQWKPTPKMDVRLAMGKPGVVEIFEQYLTQPGAIGKERIDRTDYTSSLILEIHQQLQQQIIRKQIGNQFSSEDLGPLEASSRMKIDALLNLITSVRAGDYSDEQAHRLMGLWMDIREAVLKQDYHFQDRFEASNNRTQKKDRVEIDFKKDFVHSSGYLQNEHEVFYNPGKKTIHPHFSGEMIVINLNNFYRNFIQNDVINWYFRTHNYKLAYETITQNYIFSPYVMQAILAGAVGEAAVKAILDHFHIPLISDIEWSPRLFEIADLQVRGCPVYIDVKNYSNWTTLFRFSARPEDPEYDEQMNSHVFLLAAQRKWRYIVDQTGQKNAKLVFINLLAGDNHPNEGWDEYLNPVIPYSLGNSAITIVQGILSQEDPNKFRHAFVDWKNSILDQYHP